MQHLCRSARLACLAIAFAIPASGTAFAEAPFDATSPAPRIAIIIDDLGYALSAGRRAVQLPGPVACAVLPSAPRARALSELARENGKEVLLHLPLQARPAADDNEPGGIGLDMSRGEFGRVFADSLASVPYAIGVNNHRGSLLTRHPGHMGWLMEEIRARDGLFFVDSYTTHESIALDAALEAGVPAVRRDVFLDNELSPAYLEREFARLKRLARRHGMAVGIGHPHLETLSFLEQRLPQLAAEGIELISISDMVRLRAARQWN